MEHAVSNRENIRDIVRFHIAQRLTALKGIIFFEQLQFEPGFQFRPGMGELAAGHCPGWLLTLLPVASHRSGEAAILLRWARLLCSLENL